jgi:hypothetical protein
MEADPLIIFFPCVADPGCLSRIPDHDFSIPDPTRTSPTFLVGMKQKIENYRIYFLKRYKKFESIDKELSVINTKIVTKLSKKWVWERGSGKNIKMHRIPDPKNCDSRKVRYLFRFSLWI